MKATTDQTGLSRRVLIQAAGLAVLVSADGIVAYLFGAPLWIPLLYMALGPLLAYVRVRLARRGAAAIDAPAAAPIPAPAPPPPPAAAGAGARALVFVDGRVDGDLRAQRARIGAAAAAIDASAAARIPAPAPPPPPPAPAPAPAAAAARALGYVFVDGRVDGDLRAQRARIGACCRTRGLALKTVVHDAELPGNSQARPSLAWALEQIAGGKADVLVVSRLRDLSANVANLPPLLSWFDSRERRLIAVDLDLDTATEAGRLAATAVAGVGGWEHERLSERTRRGLEAARARSAGQGRSAVADVPELADRIAAMREQGMTLQAIADTLNEDGVPTLRGGAKWRPSSVQRATGYRRPSNQSRGIELPKSRPSRP